MRTSLSFFFFYDAFWIFPDSSEIALDLAHLVFSSSLDYSHFRKGNGDRKKKKKERKEENSFHRFKEITTWNYLLEILFIDGTFFATGIHFFRLLAN